MLRAASRIPRSAISGLALACLLLAGCAGATSASTSSARFQATEEKDQEIARRAEHCRNEAMEQTETKIATAAEFPDVFAEMLMQEAADSGERKLVACNAEASRESDELARREGAAYQRAARQERDFAAFMAQLTASMPH